MGAFLRNTAVVFGGNAAARFITIALVPLITRIYSPDAYGVFATIIAVSSIATAVSSLRYQNAVMLPKDERDAHGLTVLCGLIVTILSACSACVLVLVKITAPGVFDQHLPFSFALAIPLLVLFDGHSQVASIWRLRRGEFRRLAASKVSAATADRLTTIFLGVGGSNGAGGLIAGRMVQHTVGLVVLFTGRRRTRCKPSRDSGLEIAEKIRLAKKYREFPKYSADALIQSAVTQAPLILTAAIFSPLETGLFALTRRVCSEPLQVLGDSLAKSFHQKASQDFRSGTDIQKTALQLYHSVLALCFLPLIFFAFLLADALDVVFGQNWIGVGSYIHLLMPLFGGFFIMRPFSIFFDLLGKQKERMLFNLASLMGLLLCFGVGAHFESMRITLGLYAAALTALIFLRIVWLFPLIGVPAKQIAKLSVKVVAKALLFMGPVLILKAALTVHAFVLFIAAITAVALYTFDFMEKSHNTASASCKPLQPFHRGK